MGRRRLFLFLLAAVLAIVLLTPAAGLSTSSSRITVTLGARHTRSPIASPASPILASDSDPAADELDSPSSRPQIVATSSYGPISRPAFAQPSRPLTFDVPERAPPASATSAVYDVARPKTPRPQLYNVTVRSELSSEVLGECKKRGLDCYEGKVISMRTYPNVRITFKRMFDSYVAVASPFQVKGTGKASYDHRSDFCVHERVDLTGNAHMSVRGEYPLPGEPTKLPTSTKPLLRVEDQLIARYDGDQMKCTPRYEPVPVAGRVGGSLVSGFLYETFSTLDFLLATLKAGPGFPVDRVIAGKSFSFTLKGTTRNRLQTKEELRTSGAVQVTDGSVRFSFTPTRRKAAASSVRRTVAREACERTYPTWWSTAKRACFVVTAKARWTETKTWSQDSLGSACNGSDSTTLSWTTTPTRIWLGTTGLVGYSPTTRARTSDFFEGPVRATITRRTSGGAYEFGCVPLLKKDCGTKTVTYQDIDPQYVINTGEKLAKYRLRPRARSKPESPFKACGLVDDSEAIDVAPDVAGFVMAAKAWRPGIVGALDDIVAKRLLSVRVGATVVFRGNDPAVDVPNDFQKTTGRWTGTLTFKRVK